MDPKFQQKCELVRGMPSILDTQSLSDLRSYG